MKITQNLSQESVVVVRFHEHGDTYLFGSVAAIFEAFTPQQVGCQQYKLWQRGLLERGYDTGKCYISKATIWRKRQQKRRKSNDL